MLHECCQESQGQQLPPNSFKRAPRGDAEEHGGRSCCGRGAEHEVHAVTGPSHEQEALAKAEQDPSHRRLHLVVIIGGGGVEVAELRARKRADGQVLRRPGEPPLSLLTSVFFF